MAQSPKKWLLVIGFIILLCCFLLAGVIFLARSRPTGSPSVPQLIFPTRDSNPTFAANPEATEIPQSQPNSSPKGKIVFVCQIFKLTAQDQLCVINADGSGWRRLTSEDKVRHFYPSFAPDGKSVLFSSNLDGNFKIYEIDMSGNQNMIGNAIGIAPEVSPDNRLIVFTQSDGSKDTLWLMDRNGENQRLFFSNGWDPSWSPDGSRILFATMVQELPQLAIVDLDGSNYHQITALPFLRGRNDWSAYGSKIITYDGKPWQRELILMNADGSDSHQVSPPDGNSQGPSFSPDGQWVAFTAYYGSIGNNNGCEIYIMRIDGTDLTRLTHNAYCDWQARWGP